jgi:vacuolar-type H+-ATPase subunit I/STV1
MFSYIYECVLNDDNNTKIITSDIKEIVDTINELGIYKREVNDRMIYNYIYRNKYPKIIKELTKTKRDDYFKDCVDKCVDKTIQTKNNHIRKNYMNMKLKLHNEMYEMECECEDNMDIWNGEDNDNKHIV